MSTRAPVAQPAVNLRLSFPGANPHPTLEPFDRRETHVSYFIGDDPAKWRADVPVWGGVRYRNLYPGLDLEITGEDGQWQWRLAPCPAQSGGRSQESAVERPGVILRVEGADAVALDGDALRLSTGAGDLALPLLLAEEASGPASVQPRGGQAFEVTAPFAPLVLIGNRQRPDCGACCRQSAIPHRRPRRPALQRLPGRQRCRLWHGHRLTPQGQRLPDGLYRLHQLPDHDGHLRYQLQRRL